MSTKPGQLQVTTSASAEMRTPATFSPSLGSAEEVSFMGLEEQLTSRLEAYRTPPERAARLH